MENSGLSYPGARGSTGAKDKRQAQASLLTVLAADSNGLHRTTTPDAIEAILSSEEIISENGDLLGLEEQCVDEEQAQHLAAVILKRIHARLPGRIHQLAVKVTDNAVVLAGHCSTYYSKQLAQHAAMGVLNYQRLVNNISVRTVR